MVTTYPMEFAQYAHKNTTIANPAPTQPVTYATVVSTKTHKIHANPAV
jgi:hypothetical protein